MAKKFTDEFIQVECVRCGKLIWTNCYKGIARKLHDEMGIPADKTLCVECTTKEEDQFINDRGLQLVAQRNNKII